MSAPAGIRPEDIPIPDWMRSHLRTFGPDGLFCVDGSGTVLGWNDGARALLQAPNEPEWILRPLARLLGWRSTEFQEELFDRAAQAGPSRAVSPVQFGEGAPLEDIELTAVLASEPGEARCFFVYLRRAMVEPHAAAQGSDQPPPAEAKPSSDEISARRRLMELQVQNRLMMNRAGGLVLVLALETGVVLHANEAAGEYFRNPVARLRGRPMLDLLESVDAFTSSGDSSVFLGDGARETELTIPSPAGDSWVVNCLCSRIEWHGGQALLWIGRDVTDRRATTVGSFAAGVQLPAFVVTPVAEALRRPAGRIERLAHRVADRPDRPWHEQRTDLETIQLLGDEVAAVSEDLLYMTRIADGSLDIRRTETTVGRVLAGLMPRVQRKARSVGSEVMTIQVDEEAPLFTDARLLMRAIRGFFDRSLDRGGVTVALTATLQGDCVRFVIIDSAPTGDEALLETVLAPDSVTRASSGEFALPTLEQLPLMLSVHIFRALGGHLELQSSPGMGTQVTLTLLS